MFKIVSALTVGLAASANTAAPSMEAIHAKVIAKHSEAISKLHKAAKPVVSSSNTRELAASTGSWLQSELYWAQDCKSPLPVLGGSSTSMCSTSADGLTSSKATSCSNDGNGVLTAYFNDYATADCTGDFTESVGTTTDACSFGYKMACAKSADYQDMGTKYYVKGTCSGNVASYGSYAVNTCLNNGDGTYTSIDNGDASQVSLWTPTTADGGCTGERVILDVGAPDTKTCHSAANTDDMYFDDDTYDGNRWLDYDSIKSYTSSAGSVLPRLAAVGMVAAGVVAALF